MTITTGQIQSGIYHFIGYLKLPGILPDNLSFLYLILLLALGLALIFKGKAVWKLLFGILGAYIGAVFSISIMDMIHYTKIPVLIIAAAGALLGAILLLFLVRLSLSAGFAYITYLSFSILSGHNFIISIIAALIAFSVAYILYNKIIVILAGLIGMVILWFVFSRFGASYSVSVLLAVIIFAIGMYLQFTEKSRYHKNEMRKKEQEQIYMQQ
ncbi:MAG: hypothetical protein ACP5NL_01315 [Thermoplasmata archaeon]